mmetsp:Transcript_59487/g.158264  ORF Transcript_59487/g.158264 Transcript_59487/m.158264 type:complete len:220 (-) Transcript_59487:144-803(-)
MRWAMTNTVAATWEVISRTAAWTLLSVSKSTLAKASSMHKIRRCWRSALAKLNNCRSPQLNLEPPSEICNSNPSSPICSSICTDFIVFHNVSSAYVRCGSKLKRKEPVKKLGSCGTQEMQRLRRESDKEAASNPSMRNVPEVTSASLASAMNKELFPLPVLPQTPTLEPPANENVSPFKTSGKSDRYRMCTSCTSILASRGNSPLGSCWPSSASLGKAS